MVLSTLSYTTVNSFVLHPRYLPPQDYFGYGIAIPILPFFALDLGATSLEVGIMTGIYPLFQLFGNIVMGRVSDKYGRKPGAHPCTSFHHICFEYVSEPSSKMQNAKISPHF
jgi:MFS family permease